MSNTISNYNPNIFNYCYDQGITGPTGPTGPSTHSVISKTVSYNYLQTTSFNLSTLFSSGNITYDPYPGVSIVGTTLTYTPSNRQQQPVNIPFTLTNGSVSQQCSITMVPNISINYSNTILLACDTTGRLWRVNASTGAETLFTNYDGTNVTLTDLICMATDIEDNLLFYTPSSSPTTIRVYNFATKSNSVLASGISFNIRSMSYNNNNLYCMSSADGGIIQTIYINPNVKNAPNTYGALISYQQPFTSVGCTRDSILAHPNGVLYFSIDPSAGNSQILQTLPFGSTTALTSNTPQSLVTTYYLATGSNGRLWAYATNNRTFYNSRNMTTFSIGSISDNDYVDIASYPYFP